jgi:hypothetical protein
VVFIYVFPELAAVYCDCPLSHPMPIHGSGAAHVDAKLFFLYGFDPWGSGKRQNSMNAISIVIGGLLAVLALTFAVLLVSAIVFNVNAGKKYRRSLANRVNQLRLSRMLGALGIDVDTYLHTERIVDIQEQMDRCSACDNLETCDDQLSKGTVDAADIGFCNNEQSLQEIARKNSQPG